MGAFLVYMLKVSVCLLLFFLFNKLVLSKETFHSFNRWAWLSIIVFSFILPLFFSTLWVLLNNNPKNSVGFAIEGIAINEIVAQNKDNGAILLVKGVSIIYFLGLSLFIIRLAVSYFKMFSLLKNKDRISLSESEVDLFENCKKVLKVKRNVSLIIHKKDISPFSWMNYIVISQKDFKEDGREILIHELSHIKSHHSLDLLFVDVMILFQWFNPASWLLKQSLQQTHEYQADESVIEAGVNAKQYQLLLIKKAVGQRLYSMANSFNHSKLKNRITMMLKEKSSKWAYAKCLYALPLAFVAVTAFATPNVSNKLEEISAVNVSNKLEEISAVNVSNKLEEISTNKVTNNFEQDTSKVKTLTVIVKDSNNGVNISGEKDTINIITTVMKGKKNVKMDKAVVIVDGTVYKGDINAISPEKIGSVSVLKSDKSEINVKITDKLSHKEKKQAQKNGLVIVNLKVNDNKCKACDDVKDEKSETINITISDLNDISVQNNSIILKGNSKPLFVVDGKEVSQVEDIHPDTIKSISVLKGESAVKTYGEKGKNGVIVITLKKEVVKE